MLTSSGDPDQPLVCESSAGLLQRARDAADASGWERDSSEGKSGWQASSGVLESPKSVGGERGGEQHDSTLVCVDMAKRGACAGAPEASRVLPLPAAAATAPCRTSTAGGSGKCMVCMAVPTRACWWW